MRVAVLNPMFGKDFTKSARWFARSRGRVQRHPDYLATAAAVVSWIAVTLALRPLNRLGQGLAARAPADLTPIRADVPREVEGLIEAINGFMARLDATVSALKTFSGSANHQIRTPLTTARMQLAMASRGDDPAMISAALDKADAALIRAERVLAQLLLLAQVEAAGAPRNY